MARYHHGDLPRQLLTQAASMAADAGPETISLRELARRTGVSHSAPVHHFGTRRGLLTALATAGFKDLADALSTRAGDLYDLGVTYVTWALEHPGHYAVMWQPRLLDESDVALKEWRGRAWDLLSAAVAARTDEPGDVRRAGVDAQAAFAIVHGLSGLWLSGALAVPEDPSAVAREITRRLVVRGPG